MFLSFIEVSSLPTNPTVYFLDFKFHETDNYDTFDNNTGLYDNKYKGAVIEFVVGSRINHRSELVEDVVTHYSDLHTPDIDNLSVRRWVYNTVKDMVISHTVLRASVRYWTLSKYYTVRVDRDRKWLADNTPKIREFWNDYAYYLAYPHKLENIDDRDDDECELVDEYVLYDLCSAVENVPLTKITK